MLEKETPMSAMEQLAWLTELPEQGGSWGLGITATVEAFEDELTRLEAQKVSIEDQIKVRKRLVKQALKRADKEAPALFGEKVVSKAKAVTAPSMG